MCRAVAYMKERRRADALHCEGLERRNAKALFRCPSCGSWDNICLEGRGNKAGDMVRRRYRCRECGTRFTAYAKIDPARTKLSTTQDTA